MIKLFLFLTLPLACYGQYSNYYNINNNVKVSGTVNHKVTTIDYGALANAEAIKEQNRLSNLQYANEKEKQEVLAIAQDPSKAYDYGIDNNWRVTTKEKKYLGWGNHLKYMYHKAPHKSLFIKSGIGYNYENISQDGVTTQINISPVVHLNKAKEMIPDFNANLEEAFEYSNLKEGELNKLGGDTESFLHKKDIDRENVGGFSGFCGILIWEDKYEKCITENYGVITLINGENYFISVKVRYKGDTEDVDFEQLEARKYYFKSLVKKLISTIKVY
jgi:hypothetical protein